MYPVASEALLRCHPYCIQKKIVIHERRVAVSEIYICSCAKSLSCRRGKAEQAILYEPLRLIVEGSYDSGQHRFFRDHVVCGPRDEFSDGYEAWICRREVSAYYALKACNYMRSGKDRVCSVIGMRSVAGFSAYRQLKFCGSCIHPAPAQLKIP